jgi:hypothetical protein
MEEDTIYNMDGELIAILSAEDCDYETMMANGELIVAAVSSFSALKAEVARLEGVIRFVIDSVDRGWAVKFGSDSYNALVSALVKGDAK